MSHSSNGKSGARLFLGVLALMTTLACWSSDRLFISLTATPIPTPTRATSSFDSLFQVGETATITGQGIATIYLTQNPEPVSRRNRVPNAACYPDQQVEITDVERVDDMTYYRISCNNESGWLAETSLSRSEGE
jgi:hypothetical protein